MTDKFRDLVLTGDYILLDTETTGLRGNVEICDIAIIDSSGKVLLNSYVKTLKPIPADASEIHGIYDHHCADAPTWPQLRPIIHDLIQGRDLVVYNATYDRGMFHKCDEQNGFPHFEWKLIAQWHCAMEWYSEIWGEWDNYHKSNRWQRLTNAMSQQGLEIANAHRALGDCLMTLELIKHVAQKQLEQE